MKLYHWTCERAARLITESRVILPQPQYDLGGLPLIYLSTIALRGIHVPAALGITDHRYRKHCDRLAPPCDPLAARFAVEVDVPNPYVRPFLLLERKHPHVVANYRNLPGTKTWCWWVAAVPIRLSATNHTTGVLHV